MTQKILIIDDEEIDRRCLAKTLEKEGFQDIHFAATGREGLMQLENVKPDIAIIDVVLPDIDGFDVCSQVKASCGDQVKIIMYTGRLDKVNANKARLSGADEILEKTPGFPEVPKTITLLFKP